MSFGQAEEYWRLQGSLSIGDRNLSTGDVAATGLRPLGDASELGFAPTIQYVEHRESQSGMRYKDAKIPHSPEVPVNITLDNLGSNNLRDFLNSTLATIATGSVTAEAITAPAAGRSFLLANPVVSGNVTLTPAASGTAFVSGTDYIQNGREIFVPTGSAMAGNEILAAYTKGAATSIDLFAASSKEYFLYFNGINTYNNKKITLTLWKVSFGIGSLTALISDQVTTMSLQGEALQEPLKVNVSNLGGFGFYHYQT